MNLNQLESCARRLAHERGFVLHKSRAQAIHANDLGEYMLVSDRNTVILGGRFDAELSEVLDYLKN